VKPSLHAEHISNEVVVEFSKALNTGHKPFGLVRWLNWPFC